MGLRDIVLIIAVYGSIPFILRKPFIGVLVWYWLSLMNPHRISWTLENQPFAQIIAVVMLTSLLLARDEKKQIPATTITIMLAVFWFWMLLTTIFSFYPDLAWWNWDKVWKIMLTTYVAIMMLNSKERILALAIVSIFSIGFFGFKGGLFTILTGGSARVWGPAGSFIGGNNEIGLALIMTIPLFFFIRSLVDQQLVKQALLVGIVFCFFAVLGTQSRGAFIGVTAMGLFLAAKSQHKARYILLVLLVVPFAFAFMPETWHERMASILDYQTDGSAMGRIKAWEMAFNLALHEPFGGGFEAFKPQSYLMYLPEVGGRRTDAHSIYFEVLGEQGFVGLVLFLMLGIFALSTCSRIIRQTMNNPEMLWMTNLAAMLQV
ncbi:MAG: putative O-glycosylation ligase, exosortase A system-associated, partial [Thiohalocapsa sp.]